MVEGPIGPAAIPLGRSEACAATRGSKSAEAPGSAASITEARGVSESEAGASG